MQDVGPYLSVVAAARNDDHGANFLSRLQTFVNALIGQAKHHSLPVELILVEWNPPLDRPPLAEAVRWPADPHPCRLRVVTVPAELHQRYRYSEVLPLYQMIAKNVGIRRAEGEFILATNVDILFSDELMAFLAARRLEPGRMYRLDRHDVDSGVPVDASVEERLAYCGAHVLRVNAREGTFPLTPDGFRRPGPVDVVSPDAGIFPGAGWQAPSQHFGQVSRHVASQSDLAFRPSNRPRTMLLEAAPGESAGSALDLRATDQRGNLIGAIRLEKRSLIRLRLPADLVSVRLLAAGVDRDDFTQSRTKPLWVFRCGWDPSPAGAGPDVTVTPAPVRAGARAWQTVSAGSRFLADLCRGNLPQWVGLPVPRGLLKRLRHTAVSDAISLEIGTAASAPFGQTGAADLHTNACGDFTLAHRRHWVELRGYPEFDLYSMNLDSVFCYTAHHGGAVEQVLADPMRIYHIEHAAGSGWTPEGQRLLFERLKAKGIPWLGFEQVIEWADQMHRLGTTMVFNRDDWGLSEFPLAEQRR